MYPPANRRLLLLLRGVGRRLADRLAVAGDDDDRASYVVNQTMHQPQFKEMERKKKRDRRIDSLREQVFDYSVVREEFYMDIRDLVRVDYYAYMDGRLVFTGYR